MDQTRIYSCKLKDLPEVNINVFVILRPLIKLADRLLLVGVIIDEDIEKLLLMIDPETWDPKFTKGNF